MVIQLAPINPVRFGTPLVHEQFKHPGSASKRGVSTGVDGGFHSGSVLRVDVLFL